MNYRIGEGKKYLMIFTGILIDIIEIVATPTIFIGILSGFIQYGIMWLMFTTSGVPFIGTAKRLRRQGLGFILESIPFIEMLPIYTYTIWKTIEESREEDRKKQENEENIQNENIIRQKIQVARSENPNIIRPKKS